MTPFANAIKEFGFLNEKTLAFLDEHVEVRQLKKGSFFVQTNQQCKEIAFVNRGMLRSYYITESGEDFTYCVSFEGEFMTAYSSYISGKPSIEHIQALVDTELYVIQKSLLEEESKKNHAVTHVMRHFAEQYILELEHRLLSHQKENATSRYEYILENHPKYLSEIPLQHLASYLGITQRHLSRIRKEFV